MRAALLVLLLPSLLLGQGSTQARPTAADEISQKTSIEAWPEGVSFVESPGLTLDVGTPHFNDGPDHSDGYRLIRLMVQPGEKLAFKLKAEEDKVSMRTYVPKPPPKTFDWLVALKAANRPKMFSRKHMNIENATREPQDLVLIIFGRHGYSYRVDLERTASAVK